MSIGAGSRATGVSYSYLFDVSSPQKISASDVSFGLSGYLYRPVLFFNNSLVVSRSNIGGLTVSDYPFENARQLKGHTGQINGVSLSPDSALLVTGSEDRTVRFWDPYNGKSISPPIRFDNEVHDVEFNLKGNEIFVIVAGGKLYKISLPLKKYEPKSILKEGGTGLAYYNSKSNEYVEVNRKKHSIYRYK